MAGYEIDRSRWLRGVWDDEPDDADWQQAGLLCCMRRSPILGSWCGYVRIDRSHRLYGVECADATDIHGNALPAHVSLSYAGPGIGPLRETVPNEWYFGFDCARDYDITPTTSAVLRQSLRRRPEYGYRTFEYVADLCNALANSLANG